MGTVVEVSKEQILAAIENEPLLMPGAWITTLSDHVCGVCAVGAVMRNVVKRRDDPDAITNAASAATRYGVSGSPGISDDADIDENLAFVREEAHELLAENAMNALSVFFEGVCDVYGLTYLNAHTDTEALTAVRTETSRFVRTCFPRVVAIDIDGVAPATHVKVVDHV
jgi:hypothetical protein